MKGIAHLLEDFGQRTGKPATAGLTEEDIEGLKLEAFETGYKAGWDDAVKAQTEDKSRITVDFARNLQDLSFTYQEAHSHVLAAVRPLVSDIVGKVVPELARETMGLRLSEQLEALAKRHALQRVEIVVAPTNQAVTDQLADRDFGFPITVVADETLSDGQAFLRFADEETEIDLDDVIRGIGGAVDGFFTEQERKRDHG